MTGHGKEVTLKVLVVLPYKLLLTTYLVTGHGKEVTLKLLTTYYLLLTTYLVTGHGKEVTLKALVVLSLRSLRLRF